MKYKARAKINLMLKVIGKYPSGYHELQMINARINIWDDIMITPTCDGQINVKINGLFVSAEENIVLKATVELAALYETIKGVDIVINKKIPAGSGLGGASADLACVLQALNKLYKLNMTNKKMIEFVKRYSADAPYCLHNKIALVRGIGEKIVPLCLEINDYIMVVTPSKRNKTNEIFKKVCKYNPKIKKCDIIKGEVITLMENDLQEPAILVNEQVNEIIVDLEKITKKAVMTGSGSSVIALFDYTNCQAVSDYIYGHPEHLIYLSKICKEEI